MIKCPGCGTECSNDDVICGKCGFLLGLEHSGQTVQAGGQPVFGQGAQPTGEPPMFPGAQQPGPAAMPLQPPQLPPYTYPPAGYVTTQAGPAGQQPYMPGWNGNAPPYYPFFPLVPKNNDMAIASMVLGIVSFSLLATCYLGILAAIPAIILGFVAMSQIKASGGSQKGKGMAVAGVVCGFVVTGITIIVLLALVAASIASA